MRIARTAIAINIVALLFSLWWFVAHVRRGLIGDWEFWFSLGYLVLCAFNVWYLALRRPADSPNR